MANAAYGAALGRALAEVLGHDDFELMPDAMARACRESDIEALRLGVAHVSEESAGGRAFETCKFPVPLPDGSMGVGGYIRDVTERKRAEDALRESEEHHRLVLANSLDAQLLTSPDGAIHSANAAACEMFGRSEAEICRLGRAGVIDATDPRLALALAERSEKGRFRGELTGLRADGSKFPIEVSSSVFRDSSGALHTSMAIRDLTQRVALEAQLRQAQKMEAIGGLAGGVAHDFNNVLQAMLSHVQLLRAVASDPSRVAATAAELEQQIKRGAALTRQLLLFSRRETTKPEPLDLNEAVRTSSQLLRRLVRENISFRLELAEGALPVRADRGQLDQVLMNLVVNAADAMPDGGVLRVEHRRVGRRVGVWCSVADTGGRHPRGDPRPGLRAVLHHQTPRQGHRNRLGGCSRHRGPARGRDRAGERRGPGHHGPHHAARRRHRDRAGRRPSLGRQATPPRSRRAGAGRRGRTGGARGSRRDPDLSGVHGVRRRERRGRPGVAGRAPVRPPAHRPDAPRRGRPRVGGRDGRPLAAPAGDPDVGVHRGRG